MSSSKILKPGSPLAGRVESYRFEAVQGAFPSRLEGEGTGFVPFLETILAERQGVPGGGGNMVPSGDDPPGEQAPAVEPAPRGIEEEEHLRLVREAFDRGVEDGKRLAEKGLSNVFKALREAVEEVAGLREQILRECEEDLLKLAIMVARKVIHQEISTDRLILAKVVGAAVGSASERDEIVIRLNPDDHRTVSAHRHLYLNGIGHERLLDLKPDDSIPPGGCIVDTAMGEIDARTDSQVDEIFRRLLEERHTLMSIPPKLSSEREQHAYKEN